MDQTSTNDSADSKPMLRAAVYARMSTDHQQYSTRNQIEAIKKDAERRGIQIVRYFVDEGKSGLKIAGRKQMQKMLDEVTSGISDFDIIMVYDISRWGRFQNTDEAGHYEYMCYEKGIPVIYCAEGFENDGSPIATLCKANMRFQSAQSSFILSQKVFLGQTNLVEHGFHQGGRPGYGLRRMLVDDKRNPKGILEYKQYKAIQTDRVILVPGPPEEVENVCWIYNMFVDEGKTESEIAKILNDRGILSDVNQQWNRATIHQILTNEKYIGNNVYDRISYKLKAVRKRNPPDKWKRKDGAFQAIVPLEYFVKAQEIIAERSRKLTDDDLLEKLKVLYEKHGKLSAIIIDETDDGPSSSAYRNRFGSLSRAYKLVGYVPSHDYSYLEINRYIRDELHPTIVNQIIEAMNSEGGVIEYDKENGLICVNSEILLSLVIARCRQTPSSSLRWKIHLDRVHDTDLTVVARLNSSNDEILDYYLLPTIDMISCNIWLAEYNGIIMDIYRFDTLDYLFGMARRVKLGEVA